MNYDDILELVGDFGIHQIFLLVMICLTVIPEGMNSLSGVFMIAEMEHWCVVKEWEDEVNECYRLRESNEGEYLLCIHQYRDSSIPRSFDNGEVVYAECKMYAVVYPDDWSADYYAGNFTSNTTSCDDGWVYDRSQYAATAVSDLNLVCDKELLQDTAQSLFYLGYLAGAVIFSAIADSMSRKYLFLFVIGFNFLLTTTTAFSMNYAMFATLRFINGIFDIAMYDMAFVIGTENLGPSKRVYAGILISLMYSTGHMMLALFAYLIRDWRKLQLAIAFLLLPCLLLILILPESARWLIAKRKIRAAVNLINRMAEKNRTQEKLPPNLEILLIKENKSVAGEESATLIELIRTSELRYTTVIIMFNSFAITLVYYGLSYNSVTLGGNAYVAFFLSGLVEIPAYLICMPLIDSALGRKWSTCMLELAAGTACCVTAFLAEGIAKTTVAMVGKFFTSASYGIIYIYAAEIFPTVVSRMEIIPADDEEVTTGLMTDNEEITGPTDLQSRQSDICRETKL